MIPFVRRRDGVHLGLSSGERALLASLTEQLQQVLDGDLTDDPVASRMFPDAYPQDPEASAEFAQYTRSDLLAQKTTNAGVVLAWATGARDGVERLGIVDAATEESSYTGDAGVGLRDVYDWLGFVQEHLVATLTSAR
ncbi:DUF2017 family protein [Curtobacterium sp. Csp1]|uniref:DUF2017 family protein n=1 Tax=Curtobacterium sp. Csp1 TaxID=2495429 RepID=UPI00159B3165|nr:DUF2017 family protein [Curtobacterium sp. Csp1]QKS21811.1 DUF2017 family protein [Curtobacterium sp. Csp1]